MVANRRARTIKQQNVDLRKPRQHVVEPRIGTRQFDDHGDLVAGRTADLADRRMLDDLAASGSSRYGWNSPRARQDVRGDDDRHAFALQHPGTAASPMRASGSRTRCRFVQQQNAGLWIVAWAGQALLLARAKALRLLLQSIGDFQTFGRSFDGGRPIRCDTPCAPARYSGTAATVSSS